jgi:predicted acylesterase/phospholipase RssA/CRP-like cAMP-binding protein
MRRPPTSELIAFLSSTSLLRGLGEPALRAIAAELEYVYLSGGETLMREGEIGDALYILLNGRLRIVARRPEKDENVINEIGPGETVGEMAILTGEPRSATVRAIRDCALVKFSRAAFDHLVERYPKTMMQLASLIVLRFQQMVRSPRFETEPATIALVPAGEDAPLTDVARRLVTTLGTMGTALHVHRQLVDDCLGRGVAQLPPDHEENSRIVAWLSEQEGRHKFVVYEPDAWPSPWAARCLRQADRILLVGRADSPPVLSRFETEALGAGLTSAATELVLVHPQGATRPTGTRGWRAERRVTTHHHIRHGSEADMRHLARRLTGRSIGLVLSGGGARGLAHIGVVRALEESAVPIDVVGGTSMGGIIAGLYALGHDSRSMLDLSRRGFVQMGVQPLMDYTPPIVSLLSGRRAAAVLKILAADTQIEDLWIKYFCVSTNLTRAESLVHEDGPLYKSLLATASLPGYYPPIPMNGDLLVDGGLLNILPADVMRRLGVGTIIGVDVTVRQDLRTDMTYQDYLSGWPLLWARLNPFVRKPRIPNIFGILSRAVTVNGIYNLESVKQSIDLYLHLPVEQFELGDWRSLDRIVEIGYESTREKIAAWAASPPERRLPSVSRPA